MLNKSFKTTWKIPHLQECHKPATPIKLLKKKMTAWNARWFAQIGLQASTHCQRVEMNLLLYAVKQFHTLRSIAQQY